MVPLPPSRSKGRGKDGFQTVAAGKFKKDARKEQRLWAFWVAITRSVLKLLTPVILFCTSPPLPDSRLPFRLSPPLPAYPSENHAAGNYLKMPSRRSPQKRNILRSFQSRTRQYGGRERGRGGKEGYDAEKLARKKGISSFFFFLKKRTDQLLPFVLVPQPWKIPRRKQVHLDGECVWKGRISCILESRGASYGVKYKQRVFGCFYHEMLGKLFHRVTCCTVNFLRS